ncbi:hypothetical protein DFH06DRAFT_1343701 [Mycena polygramma]|nr:hypothetical protein DFH06DRAFT_1343701 [Mycena polygramma]
MSTKRVLRPLSLVLPSPGCRMLLVPPSSRAQRAADPADALSAGRFRARPDSAGCGRMRDRRCVLERPQAETAQDLHIQAGNGARIRRPRSLPLLPNAILSSSLRTCALPTDLAGARPRWVAGTAPGQPFVYGGGVNAHSTDAVRCGAMRCGRERLRETLLRCRSTTQVPTADTERELDIHLSHAAPILRPRPPRPPLLYRRTGVRLRVYAVKLRAETEAETKRDLKNDKARFAPSSSRCPAVERCPHIVRRVCDPDAHASANFRRDGYTSRRCCLFGGAYRREIPGDVNAIRVRRRQDKIRLDDGGGHFRRVPTYSTGKDIVQVGDAWRAIAMGKWAGEVFFQTKRDPLLHPSFSLPPIVLGVMVSSRRCAPGCGKAGGIHRVLNVLCAFPTFPNLPLNPLRRLLSSPPSYSLRCGSAIELPMRPRATNSVYLDPRAAACAGALRREILRGGALLARRLRAPGAD